jgi:hypothetical protein
MRSKITSTIAGLAVAASYFVLSGLPAFGADSGTVNAKVAVASPCVTVGPGTGVDFGTLEFASTPQQVQGNQGNGTSTVSNCSPSGENIFVRGTNAAGASGASWSLVARTQPVGTCDLGTNKYVLKVNAYDSTWTTLFGGVDATPTSQALFQSGAGATANIDYDLWMPCSGSGGAGETMSFQIIYTATL